MAYILVDGHVHIYPQHNMDTLFQQALAHFNNVEAIKILQLTEGAKFNYFLQLGGQTETAKFIIEKTADKNALVLVSKEDSKQKLFLIAGRQIVGKENLEVCALATDYFVEDRTKPADEIIANILSHGGLAALNWAPGKWLFKRQHVVKNIITGFVRPDFLISDTTMRPTFWGTPALTKIAELMGTKVIRGTDPLPFSGEEKMAGSYYSLLEGNFDENHPAESLKKLIKNKETTWQIVGKRSGFFEFAKRQYKIMTYKG